MLLSSKQSALRLFEKGDIHKVTFPRKMTSGIDISKLTKSDEVKLHSVNFAVEKTPITAQLWMRRMKGRDDLIASTSSTQIANLYGSNGAPKTDALSPMFLLDKTSKESRVTIRYNFSQDGASHYFK